MAKAKYVLIETVVWMGAATNDIFHCTRGVYDTKKAATAAMKEVVNDKLATTITHKSDFHSDSSLLVDEDDYKIILVVIAQHLFGNDYVSVEAHKLQVEKL